MTKSVLTDKQHNDIVDYYANHFWIKPLLEEVPSIYEKTEGVTNEQIVDDVYELLNKFKLALLKMKR